MAQITFNIPDEQLPRLVDAICRKHNYEEKIFVYNEQTGVTEEQNNPEAKGAFAKRMIREMIKDEVKFHELSEITPLEID